MMPEYWGRACAQLAARDPVMAGLMAAYPGEALVQQGDPFATLARAVVGQQISVLAADVIWQRLVALPGGVNARALLKADADGLRSVGLSRAKTAYLQDLAARALDGRFDPASWQTMADAQVMVQLTDIKGIGRWTAEMFLIFHLHRPDVLPLADIGLQKAVAQHYLAGRRPDADELTELAERLWRPWCTVASWYLWRSLDPYPVAY